MRNMSTFAGIALTQPVDGVSAGPMLRATRRREWHVLTTEAPVAAEEQVNQENQALPCDSAS